jgi:hypothetical protein
LDMFVHVFTGVSLLWFWRLFTWLGLVLLSKSIIGLLILNGSMSWVGSRVLSKIMWSLLVDTKHLRSWSLILLRR